MTTSQYKKCSVPTCVGTARELPVLSSDPVRAKQWLAQIGIPEDVVMGKVMVCKIHFDILMSNRKSELNKMSTEVKPDEEQLVPVATSSKYLERKAELYLSTKKRSEGITGKSVTKKNVPKMSQRVEEMTDSSLEVTHQIKKIMESKVSEIREEIGLHILVHTRHSKLYELYHDALGLPPKSAMTNVFDENQISFQKSAAINKRILKEKVLIMSKMEKQCIVCLSVVNVRPNLFYDVKFDKLYGLSDIEENQKPELAHLALVLTAQGVFEKWKQLISIGFLHNRNYSSLSECPGVKHWVKQNIQNLFEIGYNVMGLVSEFKISFSSENLSSFRVNGIYNKYVVHYLFDVSYLLKQIYFDFFTHDYIIESSGTAKMQHILDYYEVDNEQEVRMTPNLTESHFKIPENMDSVKFSLVRDVISFETAQAMTKCIESGLITKSAESTVMLIIMLCTLYQILDTDNWNPPDVSQLTGESQRKLLTEIKIYFKKVRLVNIASNEVVPKEKTFIQQILITVDSVLSLYGDISSGVELERFRVKSLSLIDINKFFDRVRKNSADGAEPTSKELFRACKQAMHSDVFKPVSVQNNEVNIQQGLNHIKVIVKQFKRFPKKPEYIIGKHINIMCSDYKTFKLKRRDDIVMIAGFILKKCLERHQFCGHINKYIINAEVTSPFSKLIKDKDHNYMCLVPPEKFIDFIEMMELKFRSVMSSNVLGELTSKKLIIGLLSLTINITFQMPCECFPLLFAKKLYLRIRIFNMLKYNNRLIKKGSNQFIA